MKFGGGGMWHILKETRKMSNFANCSKYLFHFCCYMFNLFGLLCLWISPLCQDYLSVLALLGRSHFCRQTAENPRHRAPILQPGFEHLTYSQPFPCSHMGIWMYRKWAWRECRGSGIKTVCSFPQSTQIATQYSAGPRLSSVYQAGTSERRQKWPQILSE